MSTSSLFLRLFKHLLPRARAWSITIAKPLREFFQGLADGIGVPAKQYFDDIWLDMFPETTRKLSSWEFQFGLKKGQLTEQERRDRLASIWKALVGGQDPTYLEDTLNDFGFPVTVHEWWVPGTDPPVKRDPTGLAQAIILVNKLFTIEQTVTALCGEPAMECGEPLAECGQYSGFDINEITYGIPVPAKWPYLVYIGGDPWGTYVNIPTAKKAEFEDLCLKIFPTEQWLVLLVSYGITQLLDDGDMEDSSPFVDFEAGLTGQLMPDGDMEA
jgi:hypothetical protein